MSSVSCWAPGGRDSLPGCAGCRLLPGTLSVGTGGPRPLLHIAHLLCTHIQGDRGSEAAVTQATSVPGSPRTVGLCAAWREKAGMNLCLLGNPCWKCKSLTFRRFSLFSPFALPLNFLYIPHCLLSCVRFNFCSWGRRTGTS